MAARALAAVLTVVAAGVLALPASGGDGEARAGTETAADDLRTAAREIVSSVPAGPGEADEAAAGRLAALGEAGIPVLFEELGRAGADFRAPRRRSTLLRAFEQAPRAHALAYLRAAAGPGAPRVDRITALDVLASLGGPDGLAAVFGVTSEMDPAVLRSPAIRARVRATVGSILTRDRPALRALEAAYGSLDGDVAEIALDAAEAGDCNEVLLVLSRLLTARIGEPLPLLLRIARAPVRGARVPDVSTSFEVAAALESEDVAVRRAACLAAGRLHATQAVEQLIARLEDGDRRVPTAAAKALRQLSGQRLGLDAERWTTWLAAEREWRRTERAGLLERLRTSDAAVVAAALASLGRRRLFRDSVRTPVELQLRHAAPSVRAAAAATLARLGDPRSLESLVVALNDPSADVEQAAAAALGDITGLAHGTDADAWAAALGVETDW